MLKLNRSPEAKVYETQAIQGEAVDRINGMIDAVRRLYITSIAGQEMTYLEKEKEAREFVSRVIPPDDFAEWEDEFPYIAGEATATNRTPRLTAELIVEKADAWRVVGTQIETLRVSAGADVRKSISQTEIDDILTRLKGDLHALRPD